VINPLMILLACSTPEPQVTAPAPAPAPEPAAPTTQAPTQALGRFWRDLQVFPPGPAEAPPPEDVPAALGCIATGQHSLAAKLERPSPDHDAAAVVGLTAMLMGDLQAAEESMGTPWPWDQGHGLELPLVMLGHFSLAHGNLPLAENLLEDRVAGVEPSAPLLVPVEPPGPCGVSLEPTPFARWLAHLGLGWSAANTGDHLLALEHHQAILAQHPHDRMASLGAGLALMNLDRIDEAVATVQPLATAWPTDPLVHAELEVLISRQNQDADAEASWARELARGGEPNTCPYEGLGLTYLAQGRTQEAREQLEKSVEVDPDLGFRKYNGLARIHIEEGDLVQARAMLDRSLANHPDNAEALELSASLARLEAESAAP
jgi:tetratricopeptide (TPR) repeat protein